MKMDSVHIENFRTFLNCKISFGQYTCLVGPNGAGKSTVLTALNVFFRESENTQTDLNQLREEDFHRRDTGNPIRITVTFTELDEEAQKDFANYYRHNQLTISAVATYDPNTGRAEVKQSGQRMGIKALSPFFRALGDNKKVADLKELYTKLCHTFPDLPKATTKAAMEQALHAYEGDHPQKCELIPSDDQFYGFSKGANRLAKHVQWVYVPAVKDPTSEQIEARNTALGKLLARTVRSKTNFTDSVTELRREAQRQYEQLLQSSQSTLNEISTALQNRIVEWAHPDAKLRLEWQQDPEKSVRVDEPLAHILASEGAFEGELARFGHGLQRSYLLALLQELAGADATGKPTLLLACEEPELYQHPPQARHLANTLYELSRANSQVIMSTHSPMFVSGDRLEDARMVRKNADGQYSSVAHMTFSEIAQKIGEATGREHIRPQGTQARVHQALQPSLSEMFFTRRHVLVEGLEDQAYILTYFELLDMVDDYRRLGCHVVPTNGKAGLLPPLVIAKHIGISTYVVFDGDMDGQHAANDRARVEAENRSLLNAIGAQFQDAMPDDTVWGTNFTMWRSDIGSAVADDIGEDYWRECREEAARIHGGGSRSLRKNMLFIGTSLALAWEGKRRSRNLEELCNRILILE